MEPKNALLITTIKNDKTKGYYIGVTDDGFLYIFPGKKKGRGRLIPVMTPPEKEPPAEGMHDVLG